MVDLAQELNEKLLKLIDPFVVAVSLIEPLGVLFHLLHVKLEHFVAVQQIRVQGARRNLLLKENHLNKRQNVGIFDDQVEDFFLERLLLDAEAKAQKFQESCYCQDVVIFEVF